MSRRAHVGLAAVLLAAGFAVIDTTAIPVSVHADVCAGIGGRHVSVNTCGSIADAISPWVTPPSEYAPLPQDFEQTTAPPPPPAPAPDVNVCANVGRRISVSGCV